MAKRKLSQSVDRDLYSISTFTPAPTAYTRPSDIGPQSYHLHPHHPPVRPGRLADCYNGFCDHCHFLHDVKFKYDHIFGNGYTGPTVVPEEGRVKQEMKTKEEKEAKKARKRKRREQRAEAEEICQDNAAFEKICELEEENARLRKEVEELRRGLEDVQAVKIKEEDVESEGNVNDGGVDLGVAAHPPSPIERNADNAEVPSHSFQHATYSRSGPRTHSSLTANDDPELLEDLQNFWEDELQEDLPSHSPMIGRSFVGSSYEGRKTRPLPRPNRFVYIVIYWHHGTEGSRGYGAIKGAFADVEEANIEAWNVFADKWDDRQATNYEYEPGTAPEGARRRSAFGGMA